MSKEDLISFREMYTKLKIAKSSLHHKFKHRKRYGLLIEGVDYFVIPQGIFFLKSAEDEFRKQYSHSINATNDTIAEDISIKYGVEFDDQRKTD